MRSFLFPSALAVLTHLSLLATNFVYSPPRYEVMPAQRSVELALISGTRVPATDQIVSPLPIPEAEKQETPPQKTIQEKPEIVLPRQMQPEEAPAKSAGEQGEDAFNQLDAAGSSSAPVGGLGNRPPKYPKLARRMCQEGTVTLEVTVDASGAAAGVQVQQSSGYKLLDDAAVKAIRLWRFTPARRFGVAVEGKVLIPVVFNLEDAK